LEDFVVSRRKGLIALGLTAALFAFPACSKGANTGDVKDNSKVEVYSWWAGPGEKEGLEAMIADFKAQYPDIAFDNAAVAGGAGTNAKTILATRLGTRNPPDSYQLHAGLEAYSDIKAGYLQDITYLYERNGWTDKFPKGLIDAMTVDGKIYQVPVNIHRSNLLLFNPLKLAEWGIAAPPKTWAEFLTQAETLKGKGVTPIALGPLWTQKHLLENVLLGELGAAKYAGLWNGKTDWKSAEVTAALTTFVKVLGFSDIKSAAADWQPAADKVVDGSAAYLVMGDWAAGYLGATKQLAYKSEWSAAPSPGSAGVYNFLSDSFTLPVGAPHLGAAEKWLAMCASVRGQDLFNPPKGSVPARLDADKSKYSGYLADALADWQNPSTTIVGSLTHGAVANNGFNGEIDSALGIFVGDGNIAKFTDMVMKAYETTK
jgi:glucose/mannose transport system substrate-binding protein